MTENTWLTEGPAGGLKKNFAYAIGAVTSDCSRSLGNELLRASSRSLDILLSLV